MEGNIRYRLLFFILIAGFLAKFFFILQTDNQILTFGDAPVYDMDAMSLLEEHRFPSSSNSAHAPFRFKAPFYPLFLSFLYLFSPQNYFLVKIVQSFLITLSGFFLFKIARLLFPAKVALISTAIFSFHPYFFVISAHLQTESLFLFLTIIALYLILRFVKSKSKFTLLFLCGLISGMAILTRPTFIIFIPVSLLWFSLIKREINFFFKSSLILIFSCTLVLFPWIVRNFLLFNEFIFCNDAGGYVFFLNNSPEAYERLTTKDPHRFEYLNSKGVFAKVNKQIKEFKKSCNYYELTPKARENLWYNAAFSYIKNNKRQWIKLSFLKMWAYLRPYLHPMCHPKKFVLGSLFINSFIFILGIKGLFLAFRDEKLQKVTLLFILYFLASIFAHTIYIGSTRFRIVYIDPYLYIFASYALINLIKEKKEGTPIKME